MPCAAPHGVERSGHVMEAVDEHGGDVGDAVQVRHHLVVGKEAAVTPVVRHQPGEDKLPAQPCTLKCGV
jgi:hypothetical protein